MLRLIGQWEERWARTYRSDGDQRGRSCGIQAWGSEVAIDEGEFHSRDWKVTPTKEQQQWWLDERNWFTCEKQYHDEVKGGNSGSHEGHVWRGAASWAVKGPSTGHLYGHLSWRVSIHFQSKGEWEFRGMRRSGPDDVNLCFSLWAAF